MYTDAQASDGETAYMASCAGCHQNDLSGGEDALPLVGAAFSTIWEGRSLDLLVDRMERRMPQEAPGSLTRGQYIAITAFLLRRNGFPAGAKALPEEPDALRAIRYSVR